MTDSELEPLIIRNEDDAFELLEKAIKNELDDNVTVTFDGWPVFKLSIYGEDFDGGIPTRVMPAILELQKEIHRIYCREVYGSESAVHLKDHEREFLELVIEVNTGCTEFISQIGDVLDKIAKTTNMTGPQAVALVGIVSVSLAGKLGWDTWVQAKERMHAQDVTVQLSQQETKRLEVFTKALATNANAQKASEGINHFRDELSRKLKPSDEIKIDNATVINGERAREIVPKPKQESTAIRIDGDFTITDIRFPTEFGEPYKLSVINIKDKTKLSIEASHSTLPESQIKIIQDGGFGIKVVHLEINAKQTGTTIKDASLHKISWPENN
jgi:hypothetical protein